MKIKNFFDNYGNKSIIIIEINKREVLTMINNMPAYATDYEFLVVRKVDNDLWFWGAYNDHDKAYDAAEEINGFILESKWFK